MTDIWSDRLFGTSFQKTIGTSSSSDALRDSMTARCNGHCGCCTFGDRNIAKAVKDQGCLKYHRISATMCIFIPDSSYTICYNHILNINVGHFCAFRSSKSQNRYEKMVHRCALGYVSISGIIYNHPILC